MNYFKYGFKKAIPIALGYLTVSFAFGVMCVNNGLTPLVACIISATNLTSAGQMAGVELIVKNASYIEILLTVLLINVRYSLMSLSLTQKVDPNMSKLEKGIVAFGITDEIYALAITEDKTVNFKYMMGLISCSFLGWITGTFLGSMSATLFSERLLYAMNISLYAMLIAIVMPDARKDKNVLFVVLISISLSCLFKYIPFLNNIGDAFRIVASTIISCLIGALFLPRKDNN